MTAADHELPVIIASDLGTPKLVYHALTLPVAPLTSELYGRDQAFYAIAHTRAAAREWIRAQPEPERRRAAARALALAGYRLADLEALA